MATSDSDETAALQRVAVLGAGTMGAQIAALVGESGVHCDLLDLTPKLAEQAKQRLPKLRPPAISEASSLERIHPGGFDTDLHRLAHADWVIEAVVERPQPKADMWAKSIPHLKRDAILSTNTSGIPIAQIAQALPRGMRNQFLGTHFFNPPRYLPLLELIPTEDTKASVFDAVRRFAVDTLGKRVVKAHDVPGFITNRIGCFYFLTAMRAADELGLTPDAADAISGIPMGRPASATYRTIDLVGIDVLLDICDNTRAAITDPDERAAFEPPEYLREMRRRGMLGSKTGMGFYKRERRNAKTQTLALHTSDMRYHQRSTNASALPPELHKITDTPQRLRGLVSANGAGVTAGVFAWKILSRLLAFSASKVGEVSDDILSIDRAMRWGFNWELGPFETWDALGMSETTQRIRNEGIAVPDWVNRLAAEACRDEAGEGFYRKSGGEIMQATPHGEYTPVSG